MAPGPRTLGGGSPWLPGVGAACAVATALFGGCTTESPHELFKRPSVHSASSAGRPGAGGTGSGAAGGGTAARAGAGGAGANGGSSGSSASGGAESSTGGDRGDSGGSTATGATGATGARGGGAATGGSGGSGSATGGTKTGGAGGSASEQGVGGEGEGAAPGAGGETLQPPDDSCGEPPVSTPAFTKQALRESAADCAVWHYCKFEASAARLEQRIATHAAGPSEATLTAAQAAWRDAMSVWSRAELFQFGPLPSRADSAGRDSVQGLGIRDLVYAWPLNTRCRVEEQLASEKYKSQGFSNVLISARGLTGLELVLFYAGTDTACSASSSTAATFASLDAGELSRRRLDYAKAFSGDVLTQIRRVLELWDPARGNFRDAFVSASGYADEQQALTILAWALLYIEREVKDWKLGIPAGYTLSPPVNGPEAVFAGVASDNIAQNLAGFRRLFQGCGASGEGLGFDDWLTAAGHEELATDILAALDAAEAAARVFPPLAGATLAEVDAFYLSVKQLTNLLKSDLFGPQSPLNLKLPMSVQGDTD
jgi:uncharacterized protein